MRIQIRCDDIHVSLQEIPQYLNKCYGGTIDNVKDLGWKGAKIKIPNHDGEKFKLFLQFGNIQKEKK